MWMGWLGSIKSWKRTAYVCSSRKVGPLKDMEKKEGRRGRERGAEKGLQSPGDGKLSGNDTNWGLGTKEKQALVLEEGRPG